ncbi:flagellin N-terminal helical domain-containing protein [Bacillus wiedmannii]|uniref:flagellin N-terminal helical domain-containing protein n=1 Tax=Bacillus wiedmannii TaxID=1890302 RepID=UPI00077AFFF2|nr:flagellin [Bacillus wiedmannii]KXY03127.1 flagellin [Bacillus wiedmannii]PEU27160.1 flagellin [Bacillus wiedmannii]PHB41924.1 flagellin [Bacillus wiedmannii]PHC21258.1 flagellin [Bacillus wiedmannii]
MRINTNINSMRTQEYMRQNQAKMSNSMDRLSSGKRINNASDDAAGLAIATRMRARESGLGVAANNTQDGMSLIRTADSAMNSVSNILLRMRDLANQSANGTNTDKNQGALDKEFAALKEQIDYISKNTEFNDKKLLNGQNSAIAIQTLDSADTNKQININLADMSSSALEINNLSIAAAGSGAPLVGAVAGTITATDGLADALIDFDGTTAGKGKDEGERTTGVDAFKAKFDEIKSGLNTEDVQKINDAIDKFNGDKSLKNAQDIGTLYKTMTFAKDSDVTTAKTQATKLTNLDGITTGNDANARTIAMNNFKNAFADVKTGMSKENVDKINAAIANFEKADGTGNTLENAQAIGTMFTQAAAGTSYNASNAIKAIDAALTKVADNRATLGATLNRLDFNVNNLKSQQSSMASAASQIEDADMAKEMSEMTKFKILNEAGISMLSQANQTPQMVSKLLQ